LLVVPAVPQNRIPPTHLKASLISPQTAVEREQGQWDKSAVCWGGVIGHLTAPEGGGDVRKRSAQVTAAGIRRANVSLMQQASECAWLGLGGVHARPPEEVGEWATVVVVLLRGRGVALY
jgi:hypothetical protein